MPDPPQTPRHRPIDFIEGGWPDGTLRQPGNGADTQDLYVAEQIVRLIRGVIRRREQRGLRRSQLAALTGLRPNTVSDLENGHVWPDVRTLARIAWVLEADLEWVPRATVRPSRDAAP